MSGVKVSSCFLFLRSDICCKQEFENFQLFWQPSTCRFSFVETEKFWNERSGLAYSSCNLSLKVQQIFSFFKKVM